MNEDRATRYHRLKRRAGGVSFGCGGAVLAVLIIFGLSAYTRNVAEAAAFRLFPGWPRLGLVVARSLYVAILGLLSEALTLPVRFYSGYVVEHRYGLSTQSFRRWTIDYVKGLAISGVLGLVGVNLLYAAIDGWPRGWWLPAGAGFALFVVLAALVFPVLLLPLFYTITPLTREDLRRRLLALAARAGVPVVGAYELKFSDRTRKANAALTGLGGTRRILISDTILAEYSDEEIETILAHELGHHVHRDMWKGIGIETALGLAAFFVASRLLLRIAPTMGLRGPSDIAGLPALLLAASVLSLVLVPAVNAFSRYEERRADRYALQIASDPSAFISALRRLASQNLSEEQPSTLVRQLYYTHPPVGERIASARQATGA